MQTPLQRWLLTQVDYVSFVDQLALSDIPDLTSNCKHEGPLKMVLLHPTPCL